MVKIRSPDPTQSFQVLDLTRERGQVERGRQIEEEKADRKKTERGRQEKRGRKVARDI